MDLNKTQLKGEINVSIFDLEDRIENFRNEFIVPGVIGEKWKYKNISEYMSGVYDRCTNKFKKLKVEFQNL